MKKAIIIGAGPAGLTAAYELLTKTEIVPVIIEKESQVGGLSKTINFKGNRIDIGGHRFFSKSEKIIDWWLKFLPLDENVKDTHITINYQHKDAGLIVQEFGRGENVMLLRPRKSHIYYRRKFFDYPLRLNMATARNLGFSKITAIGFSYLYAKLFPIKQEENLAQFFCNRFGKKLYETFFKDYTEKVWGVPCEKIPSSWGKQRVKNLNISGLLKHALVSVFNTNKTIDQKGTTTSLIEQFLYPKYGPGQMWETVASEIIKLGGEIHLNTNLESLTGNGNHKIESAVVKNKYTNEEYILHADYFFSTMPVKDLIGGLKNMQVTNEIQTISSGLEYRDFLIVGILLSELALTGSTAGDITDNWIYIQDKQVKAGRIQFFNNWSPFMVNNADNKWLGVEYFCNKEDFFWQQSDEAITMQAIQEMENIGILKKENVKDSTVVKVEKAYPSYYGSYEYFEKVKQYLNTIENLYPIGRNGMHRYNNSDHSMLTAMAAVENIIEGRKLNDNIWEINTEDDYHEEKANAEKHNKTSSAF
ncbi:MAG: NAD(P)/FAD-dependent oxidoreductase [Bacteroidetes bacterium]|nr:NAD(P)/FAD-dependent oxidoreductase [Bacteroidota bacterium]